MTTHGTIREGIHLAVRRPETGAVLLARTFAKYLDGASWVDHEMRLQFSILFLSNLIDRNVENAVDHSILLRLENRSIGLGIRLLKRDPAKGLPVLVALVMRQLRDEQHFAPEEQLGFYKELLARFFPDVQTSA